jgi:hypothetical protein
MEIPLPQYPSFPFIPLIPKQALMGMEMKEWIVVDVNVDMICMQGTC